MEFGGFTKSFDVAQLVLYVFWAFFAGVVYYLQREQHRQYDEAETMGKLSPIYPKAQHY